MKLKENALKELATRQSYSRGVSYFADGMVNNRRVDGDSILGTVSGSSFANYEVQIKLHKPYSYSCTCLYDHGGACKHVIALGLAWCNEPETFKDLKEELQKLKSDLMQLFSELSKEDLLNIMANLISKEPGLKLEILKYMESMSDVRQDMQIEKLKLLKEQALTIIKEFNTYGGGHDYEVGECSDYIWEIIEILEQVALSSELRTEIIKEFMEEYLKHNSGMEDLIIDVIFSAAKQDKDWLLIVQGLEKSNTSYEREIIMDIYLYKLNDEKMYLKLRKAELEYGIDYYKLAKFYQAKGQINQAVEMAILGEKNGKGRIIDNIVFLKKYYKNKKIEKYREYCYKEFKEEPSLTRYKNMINVVEEEDKTRFKQEMIDHLKKSERFGNTQVLAKIYYHEKDYEQIIQFVLKGMIEPGEYEQMLSKNYPAPMIDYYQEEVKNLIEQKKRKSYQEAARVAVKIKKIYVEVLAQPEKWKLYLSGILHKHSRWRALQEEFNKLLS